MSNNKQKIIILTKLETMNTNKHNNNLVLLSSPDNHSNRSSIRSARHQHFGPTQSEKQIKN